MPSGQKLRFDRVDPLRLLLLVVPAVVGATFFVIPSTPIARTLFWCAFGLSSLVPLMSSATVIDLKSMQVEVRRGFVFFSMRVERHALSDVTSIAIRDWRTKDSYQNVTGNWVPTANTYVELSITLKNRSTPLVLVVVDEEKLARSKATELARRLDFGQQKARGRVWLPRDRLKATKSGPAEALT